MGQCLASSYRCELKLETEIPLLLIQQGTTSESLVDIAVVCCEHSILSLHQMTPLHLAASVGHNDIVRCLVEKGAGINIKDKFGVSTIIVHNNGD